MGSVTEKVLLAGHSLGGACALACLLEFDDFDHAILIDGAARSPLEVFEKVVTFGAPPVVCWRSNEAAPLIVQQRGVAAHNYCFDNDPVPRAGQIMKRLQALQVLVEHVWPFLPPWLAHLLKEAACLRSFGHQYTLRNAGGTVKTHARSKSPRYHAEIIAPNGTENAAYWFDSGESLLVRTIAQGASGLLFSAVCARARPDSTDTRTHWHQSTEEIFHVSNHALGKYLHAVLDACALNSG